MSLRRIFLIRRLSSLLGTKRIQNLRSGQPPQSHHLINDQYEFQCEDNIRQRFRMVVYIKTSVDLMNLESGVKVRKVVQSRCILSQVDTGDP